MTLPPVLIEQSLGVLEVVWINLVLSGDNAVVIALACRGLPPRKRRIGMALGALVAILLRLVFTVVVTTILTTPFVKLVGGVLLLWIGAKLLVEEDGGQGHTRASDRLWVAVRTVALADAVMSLDNVLAIAAVANGSVFLLVLGLGLSVPLIVAGAGLVVSVLDRWPVLVWAGAVLLGWVAGEMIVTDPFWPRLAAPGSWVDIPALASTRSTVADAIAKLGAEPLRILSPVAGIVGAVIVLAGGVLLRRRAASA